VVLEFIGERDDAVAVHDGVTLGDGNSCESECLIFPGFNIATGDGEIANVRDLEMRLIETFRVVVHEDGQGFSDDVIAQTKRLGLGILRAECGGQEEG
jgi:hypothetical protein